MKDIPTPHTSGALQRLSTRRAVVAGGLTLFGALAAACGAAAGTNSASGTTGSTGAAAGSSGASNANAAAKSTPSVAAAQAAKPQTVAAASLRFATLYKEDPSWNLSKQQLEKFNAQYPNVKVDADWITGSTGDYLKKVQTYLAGGDQPDVLYIHYLQTAIFAHQGALLDLSKYTAQDKAFNYPDFYEGVANHFAYQSKPMGIPWYSGPHTLLYNKTLFQKAGLKTPDELEKAGTWTWEAMRDAALKLTTGAPGSPDRTVGLTGISTRLGRWERWVWQNGGELFNKDHTKSLFTTPEATGAFQFVADLYLKDHSVVTSEEAAQFVAKGSPFLSGRVAMEHGIARDAMTTPVEAAKTNGFELGLALLPKGKGGRQNLDGPQAYGVGAASKAPDAAWELVKWWANEPMQTARLELGASVPVRKSMAKNQAFLGSLRPFESAAILEEASSTVKAPYSPYNLGDIETITDENWNAILAGKKSVKDAMSDMANQVDPLLKA